MWEVRKRLLYRLCLPRRVTPSIEYLMYTCDQAFCDHKYSVLWPKTKGGWTVPIQWKYIIQVLNWNIVFHSSLITFKLIPSNLGHQLKMTLQLPHTFRPHKVIISILKFCSTLYIFIYRYISLYAIWFLQLTQWQLVMSTLCSVPTNKSRHQAKLEMWSERQAMCSGWKYYFAFWISFLKQFSFIIYQRETGHMLRFRILFRFWNFLLKKISPKLFYFEQFVNSDEFSSCFVHSNPGDFLFLDKFTSTGFINKIYNMEVGISLSESLIPNLQKKKAFLDCLGARRRHLGGDSSKVWNNLDAGDIPPYSRIWDRLT